jgi:heme/copper-type cytochrome/quinol oxidase subunit 3
LGTRHGSERMMRRDPVLIGVGVFLASEAMFFVFLIVAYVYFSGSIETGPTARTALDPAVTLLYTIALLASSGTLWRAGTLVKRGSSAAGWMMATIALGAVFLIGQGREYMRLIGQNVLVGRNLFGTTFFTLTGFHGLHLLVGLALLALAWAVGRVERDVNWAIEPVSLYWHFVDVVWIVIFAIVYVRPFV